MIATTAAAIATAIHARAISEASTASSRKGPASTCLIDTPASLAAWMTIMAVAATAHSAAARSRRTWTRKDRSSMTPLVSGRAEITT